MKKMQCVILMLCCMLLSSCAFAGKEEQPEEKDTYQRTEENYPEVIDETGKSHPLKLGEINLEKRGEGFYLLPYYSSDYSQVVDGHYYYMRSDYSGKHTVYRDEKEIVTQFTIGMGYHISNFTKCGDLFYGILTDDSHDYDVEPNTHTLFCVDSATGETTELKREASSCLDYSTLYNGSLYYIDTDTMLVRMSLNQKMEIRRYPLSSRLDKLSRNPSFTIMDGKLYYGIQEENQVMLFSYDFESGEEKEFFHYERADGYEKYVALKIDEDYIYCQDYIIPRKGGKMKKVLERRNNEISATDVLSYNDDYIFYIDKINRLHRIDKETYEDVLLWKQRRLECVVCMGEKIYVRCCNEKLDWADADDERTGESYSAKTLFYMDIKGKNRKKLWNETAEIYVYND